jgi:hypothetical protein
VRRCNIRLSLRRQVYEHRSHAGWGVVAVRQRAGAKRREEIYIIMRDTD